MSEPSASAPGCPEMGSAAGGRVPPVAKQRVEIHGSADATRALAETVDPAHVELIVTVVDTVPAWLGPIAHQAASLGSAVVVCVTPPPEHDDESLDPAAAEARAGWEIGVATALIDLGITHIEGIEPARIRRVTTVIESLALADAVEVSP